MGAWEGVWEGAMAVVMAEGMVVALVGALVGVLEAVVLQHERNGTARDPEIVRHFQTMGSTGFHCCGIHATKAASATATATKTAATCTQETNGWLTQGPADVACRSCAAEVVPPALGANKGPQAVLAAKPIIGLAGIPVYGPRGAINP